MLIVSAGTERSEPQTKRSTVTLQLSAAGGKKKSSLIGDVGRGRGPHGG